MPADKGGCGLYRMINPARSVAKYFGHGNTVGIGDAINARFDKDGNIAYIPPIEADVVVFQRVMNDRLAATIPYLQEHMNIACVVELDDDIEFTDPRNSAWPVVQPHLNPAQNWKHLHNACAAADLVTVSTPALLRYASHGRGVVIPNVVPEMLTRIEKPSYDGPVRLGWSGTVATHPYDLLEAGAVNSLVNGNPKIKFTAVGDGAGVQQAFGLIDPPHITGWSPIKDYPFRLIENLDVGLVPLAPTRFNEAKSCLKGLEMAAVGIPFIASPTADYKRLAAEGIGVLAKKPRDWMRHTARLIDDTVYREECGQAYRQIVRDRFTFEKNAHLWLEAWGLALSNRRKAG